MTPETRDANLRTKLNAGDAMRTVTQAGSKLRGKLNAMTPAARAAFFMAIEAERAVLLIVPARLCVEAGVSAPHYHNLVRANGKGVTARFVTSIARALKTLRAGEARSEDLTPLLISAAWQGCIAAACEVYGADRAAVDHQLKRDGEFSADAAWLAASKVRKVALYLASTELGLRGATLAQLAGMTPAAVSIALGKVEEARDDDRLDAAIEKAGAKVRGEK